MAKMKDGGPAFPVYGSPKYGDRNGMSLRDWFAGQALPGVIAAPVGARNPKVSEAAYSEEIARLAYVVADAMIARGNSS